MPTVPVRRAGRPEECAEAILWLLAALGGGSVLAAFAITRDLRRNVIARLERLQHWMRAEVEARTHCRSVKVAGAEGVLHPCRDLQPGIEPSTYWAKKKFLQNLKKIIQLDSP